MVFFGSTILHFHSYFLFFICVWSPFFNQKNVWSMPKYFLIIFPTNSFWKKSTENDFEFSAWSRQLRERLSAWLHHLPWTAMGFQIRHTLINKNMFSKRTGNDFLLALVPSKYILNHNYLTTFLSFCWLKWKSSPQDQPRLKQWASVCQVFWPTFLRLVGSVFFWTPTFALIRTLEYETSI